MFSLRSLHPNFQHAQIIFSIMLAAALVLISWQVNPNSAAWLAGLFFATGLLLKALRTEDKSPLHRAYAIYLANQIGYLFIVWVLHVSPPGRDYAATEHRMFLLGNACCIGMIFQAPALFHFTLHFTRTTWRPLWVLDALGWILGVYFLYVTGAGHLMNEMRWVGTVWVPNMTPNYIAFFYNTSVLISLGLGVPLVRIFLIQDKRLRWQVIYFTLGATPLFLAFWSHFLISWGINLYPFGGLLFLFHIGLLGYAVFWERVFDVTFVIRRGLAYAMFSVLLGTIFGGIVGVLSSKLSADDSAHSFLPYLPLLMLIGFFISPLLEACQRAVNRIFFRDRPDREAQLAEFAREISTTIELERVASALCHTATKALNTSHAGLYVIGANDTLRALGDTPAEPASEIGAALKSASQPVRIELQKVSSNDKSEAPLALTVGNEHLVVPIFHREERLGGLVLAPLKSDAPWHETEIRFAELLCAQSAVALLNARSYAELERMQRLTRKTLDGLNAAVVLFDKNQRIVTANTAAAHMLGYTEEQHALAPLLEKHPNIKELADPAWRELRSFENRECSIGTGQRHGLVSLMVMDEATEAPLFLLLVHEITEYKRILENARQKENLAQIGETIASINHEIKNILQSIHFQVRKLSQIKNEEPVMQRGMDIIQNRLATLDKLLLNLRDLSRPIELRVRSVELAELLDSIVRDVHDPPGGLAAQIEYELGTGAEACAADGHWLRQVLYNLVRNALESARKDVPAVITVRSLRQSPWIQIEVTDNGTGIAPENLARLFEPFYSTKLEAGTGLGLSISKKIIDLHGGTIEARSTAGVGTTFTIKLPESSQYARAAVAAQLTP